MKPKSLAQLAREAGIDPSTASSRRRAGWADADLLTPPLPRNHRVNKARTPEKAHPWKKWRPGRFSRKDREARGQ